MRLVCLALFAFATSLATVGLANVTCDDKFGAVCIETVATDDTVIFYAENRHQLLPVTLDVTLDLTNLERRSGTAEPVVLKGNARVKLFTLGTIQRGAWRYNYEFTWSRGDITARHDTRYRYRLPFQEGDAITVGQGCDGGFSHTGRQSYAVDFMMPEGTQILAARDGRVVGIKEDSNRGGPTRAYEDDGNYVIIQHDDRTLAQYFHLRRNGAEVQLGQTIRRGQLLGYSGNTGRSTGPHLHFDVVKGAAGIESETLPVQFDTANGTVTCPAKGTRLNASR